MSNTAENADAPYQPAPFGGGVIRRADGVFIPPDPANMDWLCYCQWSNAAKPLLPSTA